MPVTIAAVGTAESIVAVQVRAQATGQLSAVRFAEGADVRKGDPLFTLDARPFQAALQQAQAIVARDTAQLSDANAQRTRNEELFNRGLIPRSDFEGQAATVASLEATIAADRAAVDQAQLNLQYTQIAAPVSGRAGALFAHAGDLVRANDQNPLVTINQLSPIYVTFAVPSRYLADIRAARAQHPQHPLAVTARTRTASALAPSSPGGASADVADGESGQTDQGPSSTGTLTFIDNAVDTATGTIKLKATFENRDRLLWPGLFVGVTLQLSTDSHAVVVPATAVLPSQQGSFVYVVTPDRAAQVRSVSVERQQGDEIVIASGLSGGEEIVTDGQLRLTPGAHVTTARGGGGAAVAAPAP
jgi:multidrug efflux system membrane fusion protein